MILELQKKLVLPWQPNLPKNKKKDHINFSIKSSWDIQITLFQVLRKLEERKKSKLKKLEQQELFLDSKGGIVFHVLLD